MNNLTFETVPIGSRWLHHKSFAQYAVIAHTNVGSDRPNYPPTVVYENVHNSKAYSRPLSEWARSFKRLDVPITLEEATALIFELAKRLHLRGGVSSYATVDLPVCAGGIEMDQWMPVPGNWIGLAPTWTTISSWPEYLPILVRIDGQNTRIYTDRRQPPLLATDLAVLHRLLSRHASAP